MSLETPEFRDKLKHDDRSSVKGLACRYNSGWIVSIFKGLSRERGLLLGFPLVRVETLRLETLNI